MIKKSKIRGTIIIAIIILLLVYLTIRTNQKLRPQLMTLAAQKTNDSISMLAQRVLTMLDYNVEDLVIYKYNNTNEIVSIEYNTRVLNSVLNRALDTMDNSLEAAEKGKEDPVLKEVFFEDGIIYEVPIGYLSGVTFLQNYGYKFRVSMHVFNYVNGDLEIVSKPYGINNSLVTIYLNLNIEAEAVTILENKKISFTEKIPLIIHVVKGEVPNYPVYQSADNKKA